MKTSLKVTLGAFAVLVFLGLAAFGFLGLYVYNAIASGGFGSSATPMAVLRDPVGEVVWIRDGRTYVGDDFRALEEGDVIRTGEESSAAILWTGYGRTLIGSDAEVAITTAQRPDEDGIRSKIRVEAGRVWTRLERLLGTGSEFSTQASDVVATVRGTSFGVELADGEVEVKVIESSVEVEHEGAADAVRMGEGSVMNVPAGAAQMPQPSVMGKDELDDAFMELGNEPVPQEELAVCGDLKPTDVWPWVFPALNYVIQHPEIFEDRAAEDEFINWLPSHLRFCARLLIHS